MVRCVALVLGYANRLYACIFLIYNSTFFQEMHAYQYIYIYIWLLTTIYRYFTLFFLLDILSAFERAISRYSCTISYTLNEAWLECVHFMTKGLISTLIDTTAWDRDSIPLLVETYSYVLASQVLLLIILKITNKEVYLY